MYLPGKQNETQSFQRLGISLSMGNPMVWRLCSMRTMNTVMTEEEGFVWIEPFRGW